MPRPDLTRIYRLTLDPNADVAAVAKEFAADPNVEYAEPNYIAQATFVPDDPLLGMQAGLSAIHAFEAWDITQGSPAARIAIIDTGVDLNHPDLASKLWANPGETPGDGIDNDGNGLIDDVNGWDFVNLDNDPQDDNGHGTYVAGIAAAATNNTTGIAGACPNCTIMTIKGLQSGGRGNIADLAAAIAYAANKGAKVINMSWGLYADSATLKDALTAAFPSAVLVAAAGNDGKCIGPGQFCAPFFPAAYSFVIGVEAAAQIGGRADFSNYDQDGPTTSEYPDQFNYEIRAPGEGIQSTIVDDTYGALSGTSMGAPFVSGAVGLLITQHPTWSKDRIRAQLIQTTTGGSLDTIATLTEASVPKLATASGGQIIDDGTGDGDGQVDSGETIDLTVALTNYGSGEATGVTATLATTDPNVAMVDGAATFGDASAYATASNISNPFRFSVGAGTPNNHDITFQLTIAANGGTYTPPPQSIALTVRRCVEVHGLYLGDTTWTADKEYIVTGGTIFRDGTLTIEPGTTIRINRTQNEDTAFRVEGSLSALGTAEQPIRFTSAAASPAPGDWGPIKIFDGVEPVSGNLTMRHVVLEYGRGIQSLVGSDGEFELRDSLVWYNQPGTGHLLFASGPTVIAGNVFRANLGSTRIIELEHSSPIVVSHNLFTDNSIVPIGSTYSAGASYSTVLECNTIVGNTFHGVEWNRPVGMGAVSSSNIFGNSPNLVATLSTVPPSHVDATNNYWGSTEPATIAAGILDFDDRPEFAIVDFQPFLMTPPPCASPILYDISLSPSEQPVEIGQLQFALDFSREMNTDVQPSVTFGVAPPYSSRLVEGDWVSSTQWRGAFEVDVATGDGINTIRVADARGTNGMPIPVDTRFQFNIQTVGSSALMLNAVGRYGAVDLRWAPSALDTFAGYNLYRTTSCGSLPSSPLAAGLRGVVYTDTTVTNGTQYCYRYGILDTDLREIAFSNEVAVIPNDFTPPTTPVVTDDGATTASETTLHATWSASDPQSGITQYEYGIGTFPGDVDVVTWTSVGSASEVTKSGLNLSVGGMYYFAVRAKNGVGTLSAVGVSDGITVVSPTVTPTPPCTGDCDGHGTVTVDELVLGVSIALGTAQLDACRIFDTSKDNTVTVDELVAAVNYALNGCTR